MPVAKGILTGALRRRIVLEQEVNTADGYGGTSSSFSPLSPSTVWASITPASASMRERAIANTVESSTTHIIEMRYHSGVTTRTRVTYDSRHFHVRGVENVNEENVLTRCYCEELLDAVVAEDTGWIQEGFA